MEKSEFIKNILVVSADKLIKVSENSIKEYDENIDLLVATLNESMLKRKDILELIGGENNITMMKTNHDSHLRFVIAILQIPDSKVLVDTLLWVFRTFTIRCFSSNYWEVQISTLIELMRENFSEKTFFEVLSFYNWLKDNLHNFISITNEKLVEHTYLYSD